METNQYYCQSGTQQSLSSSSICQQPLNKMCYESNVAQEYAACTSNHLESGFNSRGMPLRNGNIKSQIGNRSTESPYVFSNCNNSSQCTNNTSNTGNYINIMTVPLGTLQYNRKKSSSQDYHSRVYYNTTDGKCRDNYYVGNNVKCSNENTVPSHHQMSQPIQNYQHIQHQLQHINQNSNNHLMQNNQQTIACSPSSVLDTVDDSVDCTMFSNPNGSGRVVAATQTHISNANLTACDLIGSQTPESLVSVNAPVPPVMYTVHRVVTTAQIQTAVGSAFASSASVSSVVSASRNENDCLASAQINSAMSMPNNDTCQSSLHISDISGNIINNINLLGPMTGVRSASGIPTNYLPVQQKCTNSNDVQQNPALSKRMLGGNSSSTYTSAGKSNSVVTRTLLNVIPTCVYLMSRVAVHMEIEGTAHCPSQVMLAAALGCEELGISNKLLAQSIFGLWMTSSLLEMQLKSHHCPYIVRVAWPNLLEKYSCGNPIEQKYDEPMIVLKRNVFFSKRDEEKIKDHRIVELLYEEAKHCVLTGRYIMEPVHSLMLGGIQARIELGPYNSLTHTVGFFSAAFFHGQMEQPVRGIMSLVNNKDMEVLIAVNERGVFIIDCFENTLLLGLRYEDMSWDYAKPSASEDSECLTCIFLQFDAVENGIQISKLVQLFSKEAAMIDALISHFTEQMRKKKQEGNPAEQYHDEPNPIQNNGNGVLCNKLSRLTLASFDEEGRCIGQMGSLSISY
ncbi:uncharacterized protein Bili isoform X3 [Drosophila montana]|uniref:uncharacterized protein Bili isoform X3 n=1 Tax=Drosophila montana TaxID=40370 RepID=UPI00313AD23D